MISVISNDNTKYVKYVYGYLKNAGYACSVSITSDVQQFEYNLRCAHNSSDFIICVGDTVFAKTAFSRVFNVPLIYDKRSERNAISYCQQTKNRQIEQFVLDRLCIVPENFLTFQSVCLQSGCYGEHLGKKYYFLPESVEGIRIFDSFAKTTIATAYKHAVTSTCKIFGIAQKLILDTFDKHVKYPNVSRNCETDDGLDSVLTVIFDKNYSQVAVDKVMREVYSLFSLNLYAHEDISLQACLISRLQQMRKVLSVAESLTGGLLVNKLVEVSGASKVLLEGVVAYSIDSKVDRLGVNPHTIDSFGVVSAEVAEQMVSGLLSNRKTDYALSTTGYAGPTAVDGKPVGLCYIGVGDRIGVTAYKNQFGGSREQIRQYAANTAMFLLLKKILTI